MTPEERYQHDAYSRFMVDSLTSLLSHAQYTPSEMRDAALLAAIKHENMTIRPSRWILLKEFECGPGARVEQVETLDGLFQVQIPAKADVVAIRVYGRSVVDGPIRVGERRQP